MRMSSTLGIAVLLVVGCSRTPVPDPPVEGDDDPAFAAANEIIFRPARGDQNCLALSDDGPGPTHQKPPELSARG